MGEEITQRLLRSREFVRSTTCNILSRAPDQEPQRGDLFIAARPPWGRPNPSGVTSRDRASLARSGGLRLTKQLTPPGFDRTPERCVTINWSPRWGLTRLILLLLLSGNFSAQAKSSVLHITPAHLEAEGFVFAVTNTPLGNGLSFSVTITATLGELPADSDCRVCFATSTTNSQSVGPEVTGTQLAVKKGHRVWKANFVAPQQLLANPDTSFLFIVWDRRGPAADYYVVKLSDFIKQ